MQKRWYQNPGPENDVVVSSRIRLARNLSAFPFITKIGKEDQKKILGLCKDAIEANGSPLKDCRFFDFEEMSPLEKRFLTEKHIISPQLEAADFPAGVFVSPDESVSIMVNEEDHLRIQLMAPGLQLSSLYKTASRIDDYLHSRLSFAFHEKLGYLTCCPTNLGTGLRASVMVHLPAVASHNTRAPVTDMILITGLAIRGV